MYTVYVCICMYVYIYTDMYIYIQICVFYIHMYMHVRKYNDIVISEISAWGRPRDSPHHSERKRLKISQLCISAAEDLVALLHNTVQAPARGSPKGDPRVTRGPPGSPGSFGRSNHWELRVNWGMRKTHHKCRSLSEPTGHIYVSWP